MSAPVLVASRATFESPLFAGSDATNLAVVSWYPKLARAISHPACEPFDQLNLGIFYARQIHVFDISRCPVSGAVATNSR